CGDGAELFYAVLENSGREDVYLAPPNTRRQSAEGVALAAQGMTPVSAGELAPEYLRKSQAEREREARLAAEKAEV
ncbi:MAG: tRNA (adenosine(37)-N6)-threonylcarbamoyltransferase complex dimerization subunit type 1 TsaB, partial [Clostridia bacterium]|nr:tRNA (adenosine(37)-N6)-threonylcarbamoyltransferase complex dimerization subunit type 1 TsaB [Clostridia bacterium]